MYYDLEHIKALTGTLMTLGRWQCHYGGSPLTLVSYPVTQCVGQYW